MAISQSVITLSSSTATKITSVTAAAHPVIPGKTAYSWNDSSLIVQNIDNTATVYLGTSSVTSSAYGVSIANGAAITIDNLGPTEDLYAISSVNNSKLTILAVTR
jgi:hypothetical protein